MKLYLTLIISLLGTSSLHAKSSMDDSRLKNLFLGSTALVASFTHAFAATCFTSLACNENALTLPVNPPRGLISTFAAGCALTTWVASWSYFKRGGKKLKRAFSRTPQPVTQEKTPTRQALS